MRGFLYFVLGFVLFCALTAGVLGTRGSLSRKPPMEIIPDMDRQPKIRPQTANAFFADGRGSRLPVAGTIFRGAKYQDIPLYTGRVTGATNYVEVNPLEISETVMARGQERYAISCLPCHGAIGDGNGITKKFGMAILANLHEKRIVTMSDGELFHVITNGRNNMGAYGDKISPEDRWAIIYYLRALQLTRVGTAEDLPAGKR